MLVFRLLRIPKPRHNCGTHILICLYVILHHQSHPLSTSFSSLSSNSAQSCPQETHLFLQNQNSSIAKNVSLSFLWATDFKDGFLSLLESRTWHSKFHLILVSFAATARNITSDFSNFLYRFRQSCAQQTCPSTSTQSHEQPTGPRPCRASFQKF
jgi:hypothetical protein